MLRPFAEQLVEELAIRDGAVACDLLCDGGAMSAALLPAVGRGEMHVTDVEADLVDRVTAELRAPNVRGAVSDGRTLPFDTASFDHVVSLFTAGFAGASLLREALRITRPGGVVALLVWDSAALPPHEAALAQALATRARRRWPFVDQIAPRLALPSDTTTARVHDVVRFDGIDDYWASMVDDRILRDEVRALPDSSLAAVRADCERLLLPYTAADGTMRIPAEAALLLATPGRAYHARE